MKHKSENSSSILLEKVIFLKKTELFSTMKTIELRVLASIAEKYRFAKGEAVVTEGEVGESMYLIESGTIDIIKGYKTKNELYLATLKKGDFLGEMALFDAELRSATALANEESVLLNIKSDDLHDVLLDNPTIAVGLIKTFVKRLRVTMDQVKDLKNENR